MFVVVLKDGKSRRIWSRTVCALAAVSEGIKFVISQRQLSISAINGARTAHGEIVFDRNFFHDFYVDFDHVLRDGYEAGDGMERQHEDGHHKEIATYSFLVNSKHLVTLFKTLDVNDLEYICLKVYWNEATVDAMKYKLLIEIKTKKLVVKKYQTSYQPVVRNRLLVAEEYKWQLLQNNDDITFLKIDQVIPRQFLDMIPTAVDDFKLEVRSHKVMFSGIKKAVVKDRDYLKQPMAVTVTLGLRDLIDTNLREETDESRRKLIGFRLRDFKTFMSLISSLGSTSDENGPDYDLDEGLSIYLKQPGDPIVFELCNITNVKIQFVQITNTASSEEGKEIKIPHHVVHEINKAPSTAPPAKRHKKMLLMNPTIPSQETATQFMNSGRSSSPEPRIAYDLALRTRSTDQLFVEEHSQPHSRGSDSSNDSHSDQPSQYGPTQQTTVKSIFD